VATVGIGNVYIV